MNRFSKQSNRDQEATRVVHVPVRDAFGISTVDEVVASQVEKTAEVARPLWKRVFSSGWTICGFAMVVLLPVYFGSRWVHASNPSLAEDLTAIKEMGIPVLQTDQDPPKVLPQNNAALDYVRLRTEIDRLPDFNDLKRIQDKWVFDIAFTSMDWRDQTFEQGRDPAQLRSLAEKLRVAALKPRCVFDSSISPRPLPSDAVGDCFALLYLRAVAEINGGSEIEGALDIQGSARIMKHFSDLRISYSEPNALAQYLRRLAMLARNHVSDPRVTQDIEKAVDLAGEGGTLADSAHRAFPWALNEYQLSVDSPEDYQTAYRASKSEKAPLFSTMKMTMHLAQSQAVHEWRLAFEEMAKNPDDFQAVNNALDHAQERAMKTWPAGKFLDLNIDRAKVYNVQADDLTRQHLCATFIHLLAYRAEHGSFPATLPSHGLSTIDPYSGKDLIYRPTAKGFTLYSVFQNRRDDGGKGTPSVSGNGLIGEATDMVIAFQKDEG